MKFLQKEDEKLHENFEPEQQFVLRLPKTQSTRLREILKAKSPQLKNRLKIDIDPQDKIGRVTFDEWDMEATLVELPALTNSFKTVDNVTFYKTADVSQMLICKENTSQPPQNTNPQNNPAYFQWKHGITPPLKNVRKRRFRKTLKKANSEAQSISKELKYILQSDMIATKVEYRLIDPEPATKPLPTTEEDLFGAVLSSSSDDDDQGNGGGTSKRKTPRSHSNRSKGTQLEPKLDDEESGIINVEYDEDSNLQSNLSQFDILPDITGLEDSSQNPDVGTTAYDMLDPQSYDLQPDNGFQVIPQNTYEDSNLENETSTVEEEIQIEADESYMDTSNSEVQFVNSYEDNIDPAMFALQPTMENEEVIEQNIQEFLPNMESFHFNGDQQSEE